MINIRPVMTRTPARSPLGSSVNNVVIIATGTFLFPLETITTVGGPSTDDVQTALLLALVTKMYVGNSVRQRGVSQVPLTPFKVHCRDAKLDNRRLYKHSLRA